MSSTVPSQAARGRDGRRRPIQHGLGEPQHPLLVRDAQVDIGEAADMAGLEPLDLDRLPQRSQPLGVDLDRACRCTGVVPPWMMSRAPAPARRRRSGS